MTFALHPAAAPGPVSVVSEVPFLLQFFLSSALLTAEARCWKHVPIFNMSPVFANRRTLSSSSLSVTSVERVRQTVFSYTNQEAEIILLV